MSSNRSHMREYLNGEDELMVLNRGATRLKQALLNSAKERALTEEEISQLSMLAGDTQPTQEFAQFVLSLGVRKGTMD